MITFKKSFFIKISHLIMNIFQMILINNLYEYSCYFLSIYLLKNII